MARGQQQRFSTGAFARYFGIRRDTLLYYDKIGLFRPAGVQPNGYRYYTAAQIRPMGTLLSLREMNVPIAQIRQYFENPSPQRLASMAAGQIGRIDREIDRLTRTRLLFSQMAADTREALEAPLEQVLIRHLPACYYRYGARNPGNGPTTDLAWMDLLGDFLDETGSPGAAPVGSLLALEDLAQGIYGRVDRLFLPTEAPNGIQRAGGTFAVLYHKGCYEGTAAMYAMFMEQLRQLGWQPGGDAYEEYLISDLATPHADDFVTKITLRVSPAETT